MEVVEALKYKSLHSSPGTRAAFDEAGVGGRIVADSCSRDFNNSKLRI